MNAELHQELIRQHRDASGGLLEAVELGLVEISRNVDDDSRWLVRSWLCGTKEYVSGTFQDAWKVAAVIHDRWISSRN